MILAEDIVTNRGERNFSQVFHSKGTDITRKEMVPGHYYYLDAPIPNFSESVLPNSKEDYKENPDAYITDREYYDFKPVGLSFMHEKWKENMLILNLKVMPPKYRAKLILTHLNLIESNLDRINAFSKSEDIIPFDERQKLNLAMYGITPKLLQEASGIRLNYAMSAYKLDKVIRAKLLDWNDIGELPYANIDSTGMVIAPGVYEHARILHNFENKQLI